ncbi:hypothetical protein PR048_029825 [Dryococelus australis]|uniref:PiggyBac transposable element-derived protein domain-containing protein n=1 Tax=Dryococelus australis TaxID=614101 RepID=A0ABQ9G778_9NEOP|nr:hypothetical protein PR048_029825 [Dryococelus australis]
MDSVSDNEDSQVSDESIENSDHQTDSEIYVSSSENKDELSTDNDLKFRHNKNVLLGRNNYNCSDKKPEIIDFYNMTKAGVDALDQKCATYTAGRRTKRGSLTVWFAMMDIAAVNVHDFLVRSLGRDLLKEHPASRSAIINPPRELRATISRTAGTARDEQLPIPENPSRRRRCHICPRIKDQKHSTYCTQCCRGVCKSHSAQNITCDNCADS